MSESQNLSAVLTQAVSAIQNRHQTNGTIPTQSASNANNDPVDRSKWRNIIGFWMLGMCNNYGYVVMLTAAYDIIQQFNPDNGYGLFESSRDCNLISTGILLLADTIPSMTVKMMAPFLPFYINVRMVFACLLSASGFIIVAFCEAEWQAVVGIVCTSISCGLGETSLLAYTPRFQRYTLSAWASGTGAAGVLGALTYTALIAIGFTARTSMLLMLIIPTLQAFAFYVLVEEPHQSNTTLTASTSTTSLLSQSNSDVNDSIRRPQPDISMKIQYLPNLIKYVVPLFTVYVSEYLINQGLFELIYFPNIWLDHKTQYHWLQVDYQIGVLISRSSIALFEFKHIWLLSLLQLMNVVYFMYEAVYLSMPSIWIVFGLVFWEGLLGGMCYVNTFSRITREVPDQYRSFSMGITTVSESFGVVVAGLLAIPIHNVICQMPILFKYE